MPSQAAARVIRNLALASVLAAGAARADGVGTSVRQAPADTEARRAALYREGVELANAGRWAEAVARFRDVVAIRSAPAALFTLGQAEEHIGRFVSAKRDYANAQTDAEVSGAREVAEAAGKALAAVEIHLARLVLRLTEPSSRASALIDGLAASFGQPIEVDPGDHQVTVFAPNKRPFSAAVHLSEGERQDVSVRLEVDPLAPPMAAPVPPPAERPASFPVGPAVLGGAGVVAAVVGIIVRQTAQASFNTASSQCSGGTCPSEGLVSEGNAARSRIVIGTVTLSTGIAAAAGAVVWWFFPAKKTNSSAATAFEVVPDPSGIRAGVSVPW
jgi:hypothetical protein